MILFNSILPIKKPRIDYRFYLLYFIFGIYPFIALAQKEFQIARVTPDDGLSQGSNYFSFEDSRGFMWLTANDALNRYDGSVVKVYNLQKYFDHCPTLQQGYNLVEDAAANLYIGSTRGLYVYQRTRDRFTLIADLFDDEDKTVIPIGIYQQKLYCFNKNFKIACYDLKSQRSSIVTDLDIPPLKSIHVYASEQTAIQHLLPMLDKNGTIWLTHKNMLYAYDITKNSIRSIALKQQAKVIFCAKYDTLTHAIYLGTERGIVRFDIETQKDTRITTADGKPLTLILEICFGVDKIAIRENLKGVIVFDRQFKKSVNINQLSYLQINRNFTLRFDRIGRLWFCEDGLGQVIVDFHKPLLQKPNGDRTCLDLLRTTGISCFAEMPNGEMLIRDDILLDTARNRLYQFPRFTLPQIGRFETDHYRNGVWAFAKDVLAPVTFHFIGKNKKIIAQPLKTDATHFGLLQDMKVLPNGHILCAFTTGLYWYTPEKGLLQKIENEHTENCFYISILNDNTLAVSYLENDMRIFNYDKNNNLVFLKTVLPSVRSYYIEADVRRKRYWVGTNTGIFVLDDSFRIFKKIDPDSDLSGSNIYGLLLDTAGNCYCSHQRGLSFIDAQTFQTINFDRSDGIQDWDFNNRAFYRAKNGTMYFGGVSGFNFLQPPLVHQHLYPSEIYIDGIWVNNVELQKKNTLDGSETIQLSYQENNIKIQAILKNLSGTTNQKIVFRIEGIDKDWKYYGNVADIQLNNLASGDYKLQLGYYDKFDSKIIISRTLQLSVSLPFYKHRWFAVLLTFLLLTGVFAFFSRRQWLRQITLQEREQALQAQRTSITSDLHDEIGSTLSSLQLNSAVAASVIERDATKAKAILYKIEEQSKNLSDKIGDIIWSMKPGKEEFMNMSLRIKNFAHEILGAINVDYEIEIDTAIEKLNFDIRSRKNIVLFIKEALNNAAKYSDAPKIELKMWIENNFMHIEIRDNGIGFEPNTTHGNGIPNMKRRILELKGEIFIQTAKNKGTRIAAKIPIVP
jgi:signal transduction histidine kinase/ligand-binding sensor domain-containing protein